MVFLLSSCDEKVVVNEESGKPEMILFYHQTKGGVDSFHQMAYDGVPWNFEYGFC